MKDSLCLESLEGLLTIGVLRSTVLAGGHMARGFVAYPHSALGLVHVLPASPRGPKHLDFEVVGVQLNVLLL